MTRIAARTGGDASASSASRTAASPGGVPRVVTASARAKKPPAPASRTQRELLRRSELGATATAVADESEDAPAAPLVEHDPAVAVGAFVADSSRGDHADHAEERAEAPADQKLARDRAPEHDAGERRHDEVREYEEDAGDPHRARDDDAERRVEEEVPQPDPPALAEGGIRVGRDQEERAAAQPVKDADGRVECPDLRDFGRPDREKVADEHRAHLLGAVRRAVRE